MKIKEYFTSIVLYAFLGYMLLLLLEHINQFTSTSHHFLSLETLFYVIGVALFGEIGQRIAPFNEYKWKHPIKLAGTFSFLTVVFIHVFITELV